MFRRSLLVACMLFATVATAVPAIADYSSPRQYYSGWHKSPTQSYHYRVYYYKPTPTYTGYRHHYVIHHPQRPSHYYFYNPVKRAYWGRCPVESSGQPQYSLLAEKDRKANLDEIGESAFPKPGPMPQVPDAEGLTLDLPPADLPVTEPLQ